MFAVLHVSDFALQAVLRLERELAGRPVGLLDETLRPPALVACTPEALASGVEPGLTAAQAMARCAAIALRNANPAAEAEARAGLLAAAFSVSPQVETTAPGVCTMHVGGLAGERREPALRTALEALRALGLTATAGLAATPLLAWYAARFGAGESEKASRAVAVAVGAPLAGARAESGGLPGLEVESAPQAVHEESGRWEEARSGASDPRVAVGAHLGAPLGVASDAPTKMPLGEHDRPAPLRQAEDAAGGVPADGSGRTGRHGGLPLPTALVCLHPGEERAFLDTLPLAVAEPPPETAAILAGWGVRTLGQLTALTKADVTQRLGPAGLALWERAAGETTRPLRLISPAPTFLAELALEHEVETLEPLLFVLRRFIDRLALQLRNAGRVAGEMNLTLLLSDDTAHARDFRLPEPTAQEEILFRVLHTHLETLHTAASVRGLRLECRPVRPLTRQHGLFDSALRDPYGFAETLGRVAAVVGADRVGTPEVENTHRPDAVSLVVPATVVPPVAREPVHPPRGLPLRRYRPPLEATVELAGDAPAYVWTPSVAGAVRARSGPWRGSGDWWDASRAWRREEWDVELETGGVYRLLHTRAGWFVEGEYD